MSVSFDTQYQHLSDLMKQLRVNLDSFTVKGQKNAAFRARKNCQEMIKLQRQLRKELQESKKSMPTRKRVVRKAVKEEAPAKPAPAAKGKPIVKKTAAAEE